MIISEDDLDTPQPIGGYRCCEVCKNVPCKPTFKINCTNKSDKCPHWVSSANLKSDCRDQGIGRFYCNKSMYEHDTAIRNAMLDELKAWFVKNKCNGCPYGGNLLDKIKSLRTKEHP